MAGTPDAYAIFAGGSPGKRRMLETGWPELFDALGGQPGTPAPATATPPPRLAHAQPGSPKPAATAPPAAPVRIRPCELLREHPGDSPANRPPAIGRLSAAGPAACKTCLARLRPSDPGGFPLDISDPRNRK